MLASPQSLVQTPIFNLSSPRKICTNLKAGRGCFFIVVTTDRPSFISELTGADNWSTHLLIRRNPSVFQTDLRSMLNKRPGTHIFKDKRDSVYKLGFLDGNN